MSKQFLVVNRKAPHGTIHALESLEVVLIAAAFEQVVSLAFVDDGVYQLISDQDTAAIGSKNFPAVFRALGDYGVKQIYIEQSSLEARGLKASDLMALTWADESDNWIDKDSIRIVNSAELSEIIEQHDVILSF